MNEFERHRASLLALARRILGHHADAEDVLQDAWLRWHQADTSTVENPKAYLHRLVTHQAIDQLRRTRARREDDISVPGATVTGDAEATEVVSTALHVLLETLDPVERTVFLLHEVFAFSHAEIAPVVGRTERAVRQLAYRARQRIRAGRPRHRPTAAEHRQTTERFLLATSTGDLTAYARPCADQATTGRDIRPGTAVRRRR
ncbi:sigma-70 family RNA polymerase sigma factor [Amycolatopsis sp.]|uniref:sigma-70 family RNA polymerase sigma factor n=1 Tax=Amycolatopsis sp. TaxID=37632 RepID=UPI002BEBFA4D|nr:sigma-70 family RNA polymerase sigma factor [Amycolatopsis sp.]HVV14613.1 sigma-70 family RNA polymerase sigma factor [Amycolatopsis sp.]